MTTNYRRGADFERRVMQDLTRRGYHVTRSSGSHGPTDLVALRGGVVLYVQCRRSGRLDPESWNALMDAAEQAGAVPILAGPRAWSIRGQAMGIRYYRLTGRKSGRRERQPMEQYEPGEPGGLHAETGA